MSTVASTTSTPIAPQSTPQTEPRSTGSASGASGKDTLVTASPEPQISPKARALAELYETASAFVQKEHFEPFTGWKYNGAGYVLNRESGYMDVERYNNYLFDKAATTLVDQARQMGLALDKDETLAQLKADNADVAAIRYSATERIKYQNMCADVVYSQLTYSDINSLTDMYISAKENGLDAKQLSTVAFVMGIHNRDQALIRQGLVLIDATPVDQIAAHDAPFQSKLDLAEVIKAKLAETARTVFGFEYESKFFENLLNPRNYLLGVPDAALNLLSQLLDIHSQESPKPTESQGWNISTGGSSSAVSHE
jgi:hypothetical protein